VKHLLIVTQAMMRDVFCQRVDDNAFHLKSLTQPAIALCCLIMFVKAVKIEKVKLGRV
jgi:hypothetical protein